MADEAQLKHPELQLIDVHEMSVLLGCNRQNVPNLERRGDIPPSIRLGKGPRAPRRWRKADVLAWIESQTKTEE